MDFGARKLAGTAVGFYNGFNYLGAGFQGILIGGVLHWSGGNWTLAFGTVAAFCWRCHPGVGGTKIGIACQARDRWRGRGPRMPSALIPLRRC